MTTGHCLDHAMGSRASCGPHVEPTRKNSATDDLALITPLSRHEISTTHGAERENA